MTTLAPIPVRTDEHRPRFHLTPESTWMNDPNGLIRHRGRWHAFYQNNPHGSQWGNLSWGHAVSDDLATWTHLPVALPCSEQEMIFSGSVVHDVGNTSGFGPDGGEGPLVAIYTSAYTDAHPHRSGLQAQSLAFSLDGGETWEFHADNPVLDRGSSNFRDPKVFWHGETGRWVMVAVEAVDRRVHLFSSPDLRSWEEVSTVEHPGLREGMWECPDLVRVPGPDGEDDAWVLVISTNPGGPAGGSGAYGLIGDFDGRRFRAAEDPVPLDLGPDCYAPVSFSGVAGTPVLLGWMNNWDYATLTPTSPWRSAMTLPRTLHLCRATDGDLEIRQHLVVPGTVRTVSLEDLAVGDLAVPGDEPLRLRGSLSLVGPVRLRVRFGEGAEQRELVLRASRQEGVVLDRTDVHAEPFAPGHTRSLPYRPPAGAGAVQVDLVIDRSCAELELDEGRALVSQQIFPGLAPTSVSLER